MEMTKPILDNLFNVCSVSLTSSFFLFIFARKIYVSNLGGVFARPRQPLEPGEPLGLGQQGPNGKVPLVHRLHIRNDRLSQGLDPVAFASG